VLGTGLLVLVAVERRLAGRSPDGEAWGSVLRLGLLFVLFTLAFNLLLGGYGETTLVELPAWKVTGEEGRVLFQVGGALTLESLLFGLTAALALAFMLLALAVFNSLADHYQLLRGLPPFLYQAGTVVSIALTFIPQLFRAQRQMRQALALRGHRFRGFRDLVPLLVNLVAEALERAMALAESMEARGFSAAPGEKASGPWLRLGIAAGLALCLVAMVLRGTGGPPWPSALLALAGVGALAQALRRVGRRHHRTRHRLAPWTWRDSVLVGAALLLAGGLAFLWLLDRGRFAYPLLPVASWPTLDPEVLAVLLLLAAPAALLREPGR
jgi:energy-coupling factor transport system permease protein